jgi:hypothetical protein
MQTIVVMAGHRRSKNGVASLAYCPGHPRRKRQGNKKDVDARHKAGHDV